MEFISSTNQTAALNQSLDIKAPSSLQPIDLTADIFVTIVNEVSFYILLCIGITGITTNIINLHTFLKMGLEDSVTISFFALAFSDLMVSGFALSQPMCHFFTLLISKFQLGFYIPSPILLWFTRNVGAGFTLTTVLITTYLALQRCLCVLIPFHVKGLFTKRKTVCYILCASTFSLVSFSVYTNSYRVIEIYNERMNLTKLTIELRPWGDPLLFLADVFLGLVINTLCVFTVVICVFIMFFTLRKSTRFRKEASSISASHVDSDLRKDKTTTSKETQALKQVLLISTIFVLTNSPYMLWGIINVLIPDFRSNPSYAGLFNLGMVGMLTAEYVNSSIDFFIYYNFNTKFRNLCFLMPKRMRPT